MSNDPNTSLRDLDSVQLVELFRSGTCSVDREQAAHLLYLRYAERLIAFAKSRLSDFFSGKLDADDVVQSAYKSFFRRAQEGRYTVTQTGDLWALLAAVTHRKILKQVQKHRAQKRDVRKDGPIRSDMDVLSVSPSPEHVAMFVEELQSFLAQPKDRRHREMLLLALQGYSAVEIGEVSQRSATRVRQILKQYREPLERFADGYKAVSLPAKDE